MPRGLTPLFVCSLYENSLSQDLLGSSRKVLEAPPPVHRIALQLARGGISLSHFFFANDPRGTSNQVCPIRHWSSMV